MNILLFGTLLRQSPEPVSLISMQVLIGKKYKINCYLRQDFPTQNAIYQENKQKSLHLLKVSNSKLWFHWCGVKTLALFLQINKWLLYSKLFSVGRCFRESGNFLHWPPDCTRKKSSSHRLPLSWQPPNQGSTKKEPNSNLELGSTEISDPAASACAHSDNLFIFLPLPDAINSTSSTECNGMWMAICRT